MGGERFKLDHFILKVHIKPIRCY